jgi:phospholipid/cholesterol/gamma-HCH transport system substrate-binding protein
MSRPLRLGLFIVSTLSMLAVGTFLIGDRQFLFSRTYRLHTTFSTVAGLVEGAEVRVGGLHKGIVKQITLPAEPDGDVTVVMNMERSTAKVLRVDSVATIETEGLLGAKYVAVSFGSDDAPDVSDGAGIRGVDPLDIPDLMKTASAVLANVQDGSASIKEIAAKVNAGQGTLGALVNDKKMYTQIDQTTAAARSGATAFQENMEALKHNFLLRGFFNDRGYQDAAKLAQDAIPALPAGSPVKSFHYDVLKIFEDADHAKLKGEKQLREAGQFLQDNPFGTAVVVAASGMKGDADEVRVLTQARAMVVRDYLVKNFKMDDRRVKTLGRGKTDGLASEAGTVEILVYK